VTVAPELVIGVDVGGTKILAGLVDREGRIHARHEIESPETTEEAVLAALDSAVEHFLGERVSAIGYGVPSNLDRATRRVLRSCNLPLDDVDLAAHDAATLAEWRLGAGRGASTLVMLTLGTGVGGGLVLDGKLYRSWVELGHMVLDADGPPCQGNCHGRGHVEVLVSGSAADRAAVELYGEGADAHALVVHARDGDDRARAKLAEIGERLGAFIGSLANVFDPELVIVGGGFGEAAGELLLGPAQEAARREAITPADETLRIVLAALGGDAGLVGAGLIGFEALDGTW
jgi:glucokinase